MLMKVFSPTIERAKKKLSTNKGSPNTRRIDLHKTIGSR